MYAPNVSSMNYITVLQAVGYLSVMNLHPPLVIVMTEKFMNIIYFPFKQDNFLLANCVGFRHVPLCKESTILDANLPGFIMLFTNPEGPVLTPKSLPSYGGEMVTKEALEYKIETKEESVTALKAMNRRLKQEIRRLKVANPKEKSTGKQSKERSKGNPKERSTGKQSKERSKGKPKGKLLSRQIVCHKY